MGFTKYIHSLGRAFERFFGSPQRSFAVIAGVFGLLTILLMPPLAGADEEAHFVRAYGIAEGNMIISKGEKVDMPVSFMKTIGCLQTKQPIEGSLYTYSYESYGQQKRATVQCMGLVGQDDRDYEPVLTTAPGYSPTTYIPQVFAIWLGKLLGSPLVVIVYLVRLSVLAAYIAMMVAAIRILPERKWSLVGIALLPHSILQITNPGADYMLLGATAIFGAIVIRSRLIGETHLKREFKVLLVGAAVTALFLILPKGIFPGICFLPLLFFFGSMKKWPIMKALIIVAVCILGIGWQRLVYAQGGVDISGGGSNTLVSFPYAFIKTMFYGWIDSDFIFEQLRLGIGNSVGMPSLMITVLNMLVAVYIFVDYATKRGRPRLSGG